MKHSSIFASLLLSFLSFNMTHGAETAIGKLAKSMKVGEWQKLEAKGFEKSLLLSSNKSILPYANKAAWDPKTETLHFIGMCHMTPPMKHITYSARTNTWSALPPEDWYKTSKWFHAYDNSTAGKGTYYHCFWGSRVWAYDIGKKSWKELAKIIKRGSHGSTISYFPEMGKAGSIIQYFSGNGIQALDLAANTWRLVKADTSKAKSYHNVSMYHPLRKSVILGGGNGSKSLYELNAKGQLAALKEAPVHIGVNASHFVIDPASGDLLVFNYRKEGGFYALSLNEKDAEWKKLPKGNAISGAVASLSNYGVTLWFNLSGAWVYKHK